VRLLRDEMWSREIAVQLRVRGHDVVGAAEPDQRDRYAAVADAIVFERAKEDGRAIVTDNIADFGPLAQVLEKSGRSHNGLILTTRSHVDRSEPRIVSHVVRALDAFLHTEATVEPSGREHFLRRAR
jgi:hypothetical protein